MTLYRGTQPQELHDDGPYCSECGSPGVGHNIGCRIAHKEALAEIERLRARPTEEQVARAINSTRGNGPLETWLPAARAVLMLLPSVVEQTEDK